MTAVTDAGAGTVWTATFTPTDDLEDATNVITVAMTGVADTATNAGVGTTDSSNYAIDTKEPTLSSWVLDMNAQTATLTFSEIVNASSLNSTAVTIQDAATAITSYVLTDSSTASSNGAAIVIDLSTTDFNALTADAGLAISQATSYVTIAATAIDDMAANDVTAIANGTGVQATTFTAVSTAPSSSDDSSSSVGGRALLQTPTTEDTEGVVVLSQESKGIVLSEPATTIAVDFTKEDIMSIEVEAKEEVSSVYITVQKLDSKPTSIPQSPSGSVHSYLNINVKDIDADNIAGANIAFKVEKKWLSQNNIGKDNVLLARFSEGVWQQLETTVLNGDDDFVHFSARTLGFSTFAIVAKDVAVTETVDEIEAPVSVEEPAPEVVAEVSAPVEEDNGLPGFEAIFAVMGLLLVTLLVRKQDKN